MLRARLSGWPKVKAPFSLGRWAMPTTVLAIAKPAHLQAPEGETIEAPPVMTT